MKEQIVIKVKKPVKRYISRNQVGDGIIKCDSESVDILEEYLAKYPGVSIKALISGIIKYVGSDAVIEEE